MNTIDSRRYEMLVRVRDFGEAHRDLFPKATVAGQALAAVTAAVAELSEQSVSKISTRQEGKGPKAIAREAMRTQLQAMAHTARVIAEETPGFDLPFRLPRRQPETGLVATARAFVKDAEAVKGQFVGHGMPKTFVADLEEAIEQFEEAMRARQAGKDGHAAARAGITAALSSGIAAARKLDVIVRNQLRADPVTRAVWEQDRRIEYPHRSKGAADAPVPSPAGSESPTPPSTTTDVAKVA